VKAFFAGMNLPRGIILLSLLGSCLLAWNAFQVRGKLEEYLQALRSQVPMMVQDIQQKAAMHTKLMGSKEGDQLVREKSLESYIQSMAGKRETEIGNLDLTPREDRTVAGVVDYTYRIVPADRNRAYDLGQIGNFFYYLEKYSRRVRVTEIKINLLDRRVRPHEIPKNEWTFEGVVTSREKVGAGA
jgi:hypothetical protein